MQAIGLRPQRAPDGADGAAIHDERYRPEQTTV